MPHRAMFVILALVSIMNVFAFAGGDGSEGNPYQVSTVNELQDCRNHPTLHFIQICDIDASATSGWAGGNGFRPIGDYSDRFTGSYDGQGSTIYGLHINRPNDSSTGLFGKVGGCDIRNIRLTNFDVTGYNGVGGLVGDVFENTHISGCYADGVVNGRWNVGLIAGRTSPYVSIEECSSHGSVTAPEGGCAGIVGFSVGWTSILRCCNSATINGQEETGGIVGRSQASTTVKNCYNTGAVIGTDMVGGVCGYFYGSDLIDCFSTGSVTGNSSTGGLVGMTDNSSVEDCFWNVQTSGQSIGDSGTGLTTAEMKELSTYFSAGWDFVSETANGTNNCWDMDLEYGYYDGYPFLAWEDGAGICLTLPQGNGTQSAPFQIETLNHLKYISILPSTWSKNFIQTSDIDASATSGWNNGAGFNPIGNEATNFTGIYDGQGYTIDGLCINRPDTDCVGLFGKATICEFNNIRLTSIDITGDQYVGGLSGWWDDSIRISDCAIDGQINSGFCAGLVVGYMGPFSLMKYCKTSGSVSSSSSQVGGIAGEMGNSAIIESCCSSAMLYGTERIGGIVGHATGQTRISRSYNTGQVVGQDYTGGLVGNSNVLNLYHCYSSAYVSNCTNSGGLVGWNNWAYVEDCFWNVETSGHSTSSGGGTGLTRAEMNTLSTYTDAGWDFVSETANGAYDHWDMDIYGDFYYRFPVLAWEDGDAQYLYVPSGSGTESDPYQIEMIEHLAWLSASISDWDAYFIQTCDIDAAAASSWHDDKGLSPIGNVETAFSGHYDGQGHTIDELNIYRPDDYDVALFGRINGGGSIENLHMTNVDITGNSSAGGLAGYIGEGSQVSGCSVTGNVTAQASSGLLLASVYFGSTVTDSWAQGVLNVAGDYAGGIACSMSDSSSVVRCYTDVTVSGSDYVGGLIGRAKTSDVIDCYSMGSATGENGVGGSIGYIFGGTLTNSFSTVAVTGETNVGGLTGMYADDAEVTGCFWDTEASGQSTSTSGTGLTPDEMQMLSTYIDAGWDFVSETANGTDDLWDMDIFSNGYPFFSWQDGDAQYLYWPAGTGTEADPFQIETIEHLVWLSSLSTVWDSYFIQTADIDAGETVNWSDGMGFKPIGNGDTPFSGDYDGQNCDIDGLYIDRTSTNENGLFGQVTGGTISNLNVLNCNITGKYRTGAVAASCQDATIVYCTSSGSIGTLNGGGGIVGKMRESTIEQCGSSVDVSSYNVAGKNCGGLVGIASQDCAIRYCYALGNVVGHSFCGGLVGDIEDTDVEYCYSTGTVTTTSTPVGGLIGDVSGECLFTSSFWDTETSGQSESHGGEGKTTAEMKSLYMYHSYGWDFVSEHSNGTADTWDIDQDGSCNDGYPVLSWETGEQYFTGPSGSGTGSSPYLIEQLTDLWWISVHSDEWSKVYLQTADIDASDTETWYDGCGFSPIGSGSTSFTGSYNGQGYTIDGLFINRPDTDNVGFFGLGCDCEISNVQLMNINITGQNFVGGLAGQWSENVIATGCKINGYVYSESCAGLVVGLMGNDITVQDCCTSEYVSSNVNHVGGITGLIEGSATIERCCNSATVHGGNRMGGIAGWISGPAYIGNCYSTGSISGYGGTLGGLIGFCGYSEVVHCYSTGNVSERSNSGGLIGVSFISSVEDCFWDVDTSGYDTSSGGTGLTTEYMRMLSTYIDAGWDFVAESDNGSDDYWDMDIYNEYSDGYPYLSWQDGDGQSMCIIQGNGTTEDPYLIGLPAELQWMSRSPSEWDKCFRQIADIDASDTENWDNGKGFSPVGNTSTAFSGEYDGQGYSIDGLFIHRDSTNENALFGLVTGGTILNLNVLNCNITGKFRTSAIAASCDDATIADCTSSGSISTLNGGGGIVGRMRETTVEHCGSSVDVSSYSNDGKNCGGLVGIGSLDCVISNCYAHGSVEACNFCGGLIGDMEDTDVQYCYSTGTVTTTSTPVGGLIGEIGGTYSVEGCFWDTGTSGQSTSPAGTGKTTAEMQTRSTYTDAGWDFLGESENGTDDIWFIATDNYPEFNDFTAPVITAIEDIPHDQGHQVMVCWDEAKTDTHDDPESCYKLYRMVSDQWELLATIPDDNAEYTYNAATLVDSSATLELDDFLTTFKVVYEWSTGSIESATATGYSVDNISPYATSGVTLTFSGSRDESVSLTRKSSVKLPSAATRTTSAILSWNQVTEGGFGGNSYPEQNGVWYRVYAGDTPDFPCDGSTLLGTTQDTSYEITPMDSVQKFFKVVVSDQP